MEEQFIFLLKYATIKQVKDFIGKNVPMNLHHPTPNLDTPLIAAIRRGEKEIVSFLIDKNPCDLNETLTYPCGKTILMHASFVLDSPEVLQLLIRKGADPQKLDFRGWTCIQYAIIGERMKNISFLLDYGIPVNLFDFEHRTPLMISVYLSSTDVLSLLLEYGADSNLKNEEGLTALQLAILWRRRDAAIILLENGADTRVITPLTKATLGQLSRMAMPNVLRCIESL